MIRHEQLRPMVGLIALGVLAVVAVVAVHQSTGPVALESIANLQPQPAELSLKPLGFKVAKESILEDVKQFSVCVNEASTVDEGVWCLSQLIALLPRPLERRATEVAKEIASTRTPTNDPKLLAVRLESCLTAAMERDGAIYCVSELLAQIPPTALAKAIEMGEEHPAFPWKMAHESAVNDAATFETCATEATDEDQGSKCIGELLAQLPEAMVERAVRVAMELPAPGGSPTEPKAVAGKLHECLEVADGRDAASFCLVDFLLSIPQGQMKDGYLWSKEHRGLGEPFVTTEEEVDHTVATRGSARGGAGVGLGGSDTAMELARIGARPARGLGRKGLGRK